MTLEQLEEKLRGREPGLMDASGQYAVLVLSLIHISWGHVQGLGPRHSEGGGIVPVSGVFGDLHGGLHLCSAGQHTCCNGPLVRGLGQLSDLSPRGLDHIAHLSYHTLQ